MTFDLIGYINKTQEAVDIGAITEEEQGSLIWTTLEQIKNIDKCNNPQEFKAWFNIKEEDRTHLIRHAHWTLWL